ncbi:hypothetical protein ACNHYB_12310 [Isoptericola jiangsuensis]|uniref:hypothetical protein n=1 Tax=Isoptericola jiangsuensis TaxID=548579 RepID=UPI003AAE2F84
MRRGEFKAWRTGVVAVLCAVLAAGTVVPAGAVSAAAPTSTLVTATKDAPPTIRWSHTPKRHLARKKATKRQSETETWRRPTFRWAGQDDRAGLRYEVRVREFFGARPGKGYATGWQTMSGETASSSYRPWVYAGRTLCVQARAVDTAGQRSAWTPKRCTTMPVQGSDLLGPQTSSAYRNARTTVGQGRNQQVTMGGSWKVKGGAVRIGVAASPGAGELDVYVGKRKIGHVDARSSKRRVKYVTVDPRKDFGWGKLRLVGTEGVVDVHSYVILP